MGIPWEWRTPSDQGTSPTEVFIVILSITNECQCCSWHHNVVKIYIMFQSCFNLTVTVRDPIRCNYRRASKHPEFRFH